MRWSEGTRKLATPYLGGYAIGLPAQLRDPRDRPAHLLDPAIGNTRGRGAGGGVRHFHNVVFERKLSEFYGEPNGAT